MCGNTPSERPLPPARSRRNKSGTQTRPCLEPGSRSPKTSPRWSWLLLLLQGAPLVWVEKVVAGVALHPDFLLLKQRIESDFVKGFENALVRYCYPCIPGPTNKKNLLFKSVDTSLMHDSSVSSLLPWIHLWLAQPISNSSLTLLLKSPMVLSLSTSILSGPLHEFSSSMNNSMLKMRIKNLKMPQGKKNLSE